MHPETVWESSDLRSRLIRAALMPLSGLYAFGWWCYLTWYRLGFKRAQTAHRRTIVVGNLVAGGAGKTPFTIALVQTLGELGESVAISTSGYGGPKSRGAHLAPDGPLRADEWGDEPAMLRTLLPDVPIIVGRGRLAASQLALRHFPDRVLVMDDGFQHLPVVKQLSIVLDPPRRNRHCLPAGPYREPRRYLRRADLVIPDRWQVEPVLPTLELAAETYAVICAIGQPERFLASVRQALPHARAVTVRVRPDHDSLQDGNLFDGIPPEVPILVTAKDDVKLRLRPDLGERRIVVVPHAIRVTPEAEWRDWLRRQLHEKLPKTTP
ncbi:MAG: tetraacyldisaccharide 4'-kinase [Fimbriimonadaceae bacterium]|nr:tetraacyldisaccharide 4'-kinase [Fimbriimonadaceae bacterium]